MRDIVGGFCLKYIFIGQEKTLLIVESVVIESKCNNKILYMKNSLCFHISVYRTQFSRIKSMSIRSHISI